MGYRPNRSLPITFCLDGHLTDPRRVNSKATLKVDLGRLLDFVPALLHGPIKESRYCTKKSHEIIISSDDSRSQGDNRHNCHVKLHKFLIEAAKSVIPRETSAAQRDRVRHL